MSCFHSLTIKSSVSKTLLCRFYVDVFSLSVLVLNGLFFLIAVWLFKELSDCFSKVTSLVDLCTKSV